MPVPTRRPEFAVHDLFAEPLRSMLHPLEPALQKLLSFDRLFQAYDLARSAPADHIDVVRRLIASLQIEYSAPAGDLSRVPLSGPTLVVANHPFGFIEGAILLTLLSTVRQDIRILANSLLSVVPELAHACIFVDPFGGRRAVEINRRPLRDCIRWLRQGGLLVVFPAGEVSHLDWARGGVVDPEWNPAIARLAEMSQAQVVPAFFRGSNSLPFHITGLIHPMMRTASLARELLNKRRKTIELRIGQAILPDTLAAFGNPGAATEYLRYRTLLLQGAGSAPKVSLGERWRRHATIAGPQPLESLRAEIEKLGPQQRLCEARNLQVYLASAQEAPRVLREIGRLREITFRQAGEGSGNSLDLDRFDTHYGHLFVWDREAQRIAGGYRLADTRDVLPKFGVQGLYTSTLFRYDRHFFSRLGGAIELGRSFVCPEYQRQYLPLLLLWKAIAVYVTRRPESPILFGGVSISNEYKPVSKDILVRFLRAHQADRLRGQVSPRNAYRGPWRVTRMTSLEALPLNVEEVSRMLAELEPQGTGVPILVKHYLKLGGRLLCINRDPAFSNVLDALLMVDLRHTPPAVLEKYMGKTETAAFLQHHTIPLCRPSTAPGE